MEYVTLAFSIISAVVAVIVLIIVLKNKKTGDLSLGDNDLDKITQTKDFMHAVIQVTANDLRNTSGELISVLLKNWRKRDKPWDVYNRSVDGYFAVLDDNDQKKQILKQKFRDIVHFYKGWIYFAPTNSIEERLLEATITHFGGATIDFIIIKKTIIEAMKRVTNRPISLFKRYFLILLLSQI